MKKVLSTLLACLMLGSLLPLAAIAETQWGEGVTVLTALSTYAIAGSQWGDDPVSRAFTEKTGVALNIEYSVGDFNEKLGALIAAGDYPDLILSIDNHQLRSLVNANALVDMTDLIEQKGENIKAAFGNQLGAMQYNDRKIYGVNKEFGAVPSYRDWYIQIQYPVLHALGYPTIETLADLESALEAFMALPENKDQGYIPLLVPAGGDAIRHGISNAAMRVAGFQDDGEFYVDASDLDNLRVKYALATPEAGQFLKWLNGMYHKGLLDPQSFTLDHNKTVERVAQGKVLCVIEPEWALRETEAGLRNEVNGMADKCYAKMPIYLNSEDKKNSDVSNYDSLGTWKSVITANCKNVDKAFEFIDYMWSEEAQVMAWWGIEGEHYDMIDGKRVLRDEVLDAYQADKDFGIKTGISLYNYFTVGSLVKDSTGQYVNPFTTPETIARTYTQQDKEILGIYYNKLRDSQLAEGTAALPEYDEKTVNWADLWPVPRLSPWGFTWKMTISKIKGAKVQPSKAQTKLKEEINIVSFQQMVMGEIEDFDKAFEEYVALCYSDSLVNGLTGGIRPLEEQYEQMILKRLQTWYGDDWKNIVGEMLK